MPPLPRLFPGDLELAKRDDDHKHRSKSLPRLALRYLRLPVRKNVKRSLIGLVVLIGLYYFFKNMPPDLEGPTPRPYYSYPPTSGRVPKGTKSQGATSGRHPALSYLSKQFNKDEATDQSEHWFNGPIKFYELAATLYAIGVTRGAISYNRNVLFAASSLKSASILLPLACEMASYERNHVHFAFLGRDDVSIEMLKEVNGVKDDCNIWLHDGRPDYSTDSSDFRMEVSTSAALSHINNFMQPQAVIIDNSGMEDEFLIKAFRERAPSLGRTLIELPRNTEQVLMWITRLDSTSLKWWNKVSVDIIVHAQPSASGSLLRLLDSLWKADYFGSPAPRLAIELPHVVDEPTRQFLRDFTWPPSHPRTQGNGNRLVIHRRIPHHHLTPEENSIRFLESFWPSDPTASHVLVLSPQVELSPLFYHYLKYIILEYKYAESRGAKENLLGISLDLPSSHLNDTAIFSPPRHTVSDDGSDLANPFLWQAPNSNAAIYFGDKWEELQSFTSNMLSTSKSSSAKLVSKTYPSWLESILRLARTRGYYMIYPHFSDDAAIATVHNELYRAPEEFSYSSENPEPVDSTVDFTADLAHHISLQHKEPPLASTTLLNILPFKGIPPPLYEMPLLSWSGEAIDWTELEQSADTYSGFFRREFGGCGPRDLPRPRSQGSVADLFCQGEVTEALAEPATVSPSNVAPPTPSETASPDDLQADLGVLIEKDDKGDAVM